MPNYTTTITLSHPEAKFGNPVFVRDGQAIEQGEGLNDWMKERNLTKEEVATITGRSPSTVRGWLYGRAGGGRPMDAAAMNALAQFDKTDRKP